MLATILIIVTITVTRVQMKPGHLENKSTAHNLNETSRSSSNV